VLKRYYQTILGVILLVMSLFFLVAIVGYNHADYPSLLQGSSVTHIAGPIGAWTGHMFRSLFGIASSLFILSLIFPACFLIGNTWINRVTEKTIVSILLTVSVSALVSLFITGASQESGGAVGIYIASKAYTFLGRTIAYILFSSISMIILILLIVLFLSPEHDHIEVTSTFSNVLRNFLHRLPFVRGKDEIPLIQFKEKRDRKNSGFPWIIKKRIVVYQTETAESPLTFLKRPQLPDAENISEIGLLTDARDYEEQDAEGSVESEEAALGQAHDVVLQEDEYCIDNSSDTLAAGCMPEVEEDDPDSEMAIDDPVPSVQTRREGSEDEYKEEESSEEEIQVEDLVRHPVSTADINKHVFDDIPINEEYIIPTSYLTSSKPLDTENWKNEIRKNSILLKNTLAEFGIESDVVNVNRGPVITLYEMQIAPGIKVNRIVGLADDIAMALAAQRVRIVAPIPGKSAIGVEIPNRYRETVTLGDIIKSDEYQNYNGSLSVALGKDILGNPVMLDLKRLPHLLIAGTTGSGKSVCVNSIIMSLLYNYEPNYLRFIMIDPKMVELQFYNGLPHLLTPVIVDPQVAPMVLKWTMHEMERRYCLLAEMNTRDIERYNEKIGKQRKDLEKLPYIVAIIDEMADLMMSSKEVEGYITRIAQKSRAVGIHLVVATQRPSVDIITGLIKANFPARIAFQVAQKTDSRTIIDQNGAEKLLGRGDMLYQSPTSSFPMRIQGGFISEDEIERIVNHLCRMGKPSYIDIEDSLTEEEESRGLDEAGDELFQEALKIIEETKKASASYLQRRLSIGYNRAARIIEQMEEMGYIGPQIGSKPREVFV
jgi:DNA segregation ATPase FtsK/SpoIIIE-like protein